MKAMGILVRYGYAVVFGTVLAEQIGLPIPAIPVMLAAGALVGGGYLSLMLLLALSGVASLMADTVWYWIGRAGGARVLGLLCRISLERDTCVRKTEGIFARHGARSLLIAKFIPGFSTIAPPLAGVVRMPFSHFAFFSGLGGLIWASAFMAIGWVFTNQIEMIGGYIARLGSWILALVVVAFGGYIGAKYISRRRFLRKMRITRITPEELKTKLDGGEEMIVVDVRRGIERIRPLAGGYHGWRDRGYPMTELTIATNGGTNA